MNLPVSGRRGSLPLTGTTIKSEPKAYLKLEDFFEKTSEKFDAEK